MRRSPTRVYSCEFWKIFITSFFTELLRWLLLEADYHKCYARLLVWNILQKLQERPVLGEGPLVKFQANSFIKKLLCDWCFHLNFAKVFRTVFLKNTFNWMLLNRLVMVTTYSTIDCLLLLFYVGLLLKISQLFFYINMHKPEEYLGPCQTSMVEFLQKQPMAFSGSSPPKLFL